MAGHRAKAVNSLFDEGDKGDEGDAMGLLLSGQIAVHKQDAAGFSQFVTHIVAGRTFGEMAAIDGEKRSASCTATQAYVLAMLPKDQFERIQIAQRGPWHQAAAEGYLAVEPAHGKRYSSGLSEQRYRLIRHSLYRIWL